MRRFFTVTSESLIFHTVFIHIVFIQSSAKRVFLLLKSLLCERTNTTDFLGYFFTNEYETTNKVNVNQTLKHGSDVQIG